MSYRVLEDVALADVALEATAAEWPELFSEAAKAFWSIQLEDLATIQLDQAQKVHLRRPALDMLLYAFLQELIYWKDAKGMIFLAADVQIQAADQEWSLQAELKGEKLDPARHRQVVDVKAVTLHRLAVQRRGDVWQAHFVLDI